MLLWKLINIVHPTNNTHAMIYMQYIPRMMKTNMLLYNGIQCTKLECRCFGLSTFWFVDVLVCRRFGLSMFRFVDISVCRRLALSTFGSVDVSVCRRFGLSTFWLSTFRFVDVLTSYLSGHWLSCSACYQYLLNMKCLMYGLLFLQLSTSLGCFCPWTFFLKNGLD